MCSRDWITDEVPDDVGGKKPSLCVIGGQNSTMQSQSFSSCQNGLEIVFALRSQDRQITFFQNFGSKLAIHRRYTLCLFLDVPYCYLQGITVRPVPCNYNVIQHMSALSRR